MSADDTYDDTMRYGHDYHLGGKITRPLSDILGDSVPVLLSEGKVITDPDEAEALGLTVDARRMREEGTADLSMWPLEMLEAINETGIWPQSGDCE